MATNQLTLITPTSDRPIAFELCERWMRRAMDRFEGELQWIVADDGVTPVNCTLGQEHVRRRHFDNKKRSFLGNLRAALKKVRYDKVLFIEDDDWYAADYLTTMSRWLDDAEICGEGRARYYHLPSRRFRLCSNTHHASLCQTGIRGDLISWLETHVAELMSKFVDVQLWNLGAKDRKQILQPRTSLSVGMKGLPGKSGIGVGHRLGHNSRYDPDGSVLRSWIPSEDVGVYLTIAGEHPPSATGAPRLTSRLDVINYLMELKNYQSYLEIGCETDRTFNRVKAPDKVGVDPQSGGTLRMTSDTFFAFNQQKFDLIFIDGLHVCEQVLRDVTNSIKSLHTGGCIVIHDCLPIRRRQQFEERPPGCGGWTGNVWKAVVQLRTDPNLDIAVLNSDWGVGVVFPRPNTDMIQLPEQMNWNSFQSYKNQWLRVMENDEFLRFLKQD